VANLRHYAGTCLEGLRKTTKDLKYDSRSPGEDKNPGLPEYEVGVLTIQPRRSITMGKEYPCFFYEIILSTNRTTNARHAWRNDCAVRVMRKNVNKILLARNANETNTAPMVRSGGVCVWREPGVRRSVRLAEAWSQAVGAIGRNLASVAVRVF
jgi:hypothetical protein